MNNSIFFFFYNLAHQSAYFDRLIVFLAVYFPYIVIMLAGLFLLFHHEVFLAESPWEVFLQKKQEILLAFFTGSLAWVLAKMLKVFIHTARPFADLPGVHPLFFESGYSFPSGHATFFMGLAFSIFFQHKKAGYVFMGCALLIGLARIAGGVHFPVDILGGFVLGGAVSYVVAFIAKNV
jgi:undecaprenyl-diphosphatase